MGESEARAVAYTPERLSPKRHLKEQLRRVQALDGVLLPISSAPAPVRVIWPGKGYELARKVRDEFEKTGRPTDELTAAYEQACQRYVQKNGRLFTPKSLREGLRRKVDEVTGHLRGR